MHELGVGVFWHLSDLYAQLLSFTLEINWLRLRGGIVAVHSSGINCSRVSAMAVGI